MLVHLAAENGRRTQEGLPRRLQHRIQDGRLVQAGRLAGRGAGLAHIDAMPEALLHAVAAIRQSRPTGTAEADGAWPEPKPIIAELKPVPAFDAETLLPEVLRAWIMDEAERMPCPPDFITAAALVALGSIVGARCTIQPKGRDSWLIVPNLWGGIVGDPSAKKSPAWAQP